MEMSLYEKIAFLCGQFSLRTEGAHIFYIQFRYRKVI